MRIVVVGFVHHYLEVVATINALQVVCELPVAHVRSERRVHKPPGGSTDSRHTDVTTDCHVSVKKETILNFY